MRHAASALCLCLWWADIATAQEPPQNPALSRTAYSLLQADDELAELNLGVRVDGKGVAVLWGTVPTRQFMAKAEKKLEGIPGVTAIVNQCEVTTPTDTFLKEVSAALKGAAPAPVPAAQAAAPLPQADQPPPERKAVTALKPPADFITTGHGPPTAQPTARLLEPEAAPTPEPDYQAIERLRASDRRYADLRLELRDGRIVVSGRAADPATAWELARKMAPLAGSRDIVVGRVTGRD